MEKTKTSGTTRREVLRLALVTPALAVLPKLVQPLDRNSKGFGRQSLIDAPGFVVPAAAQSSARQLKLIRQWQGSLCHSRLINQGTESIRVKEVVLFDLVPPLPASTGIYGEGFQMLSQSGGTLGQPVDLGNYTDAKHYRLPAPEGARTFYGMMTLTRPDKSFLLAFTSCRRFIGQFYLQGPSLRVVIDAEGREIKPGEVWELEEFTFRSGPDREQLLADLAERLVRNHPPQHTASPPTGWCSWYCFGPRVTAQQVLDNLDFIAKRTPGLKYIQIDDGYQPAMGDWLETGSAFGGNVQGVLKQIRERNFEPAIWVAPFVAEEKSHIFQQHPDWFVKDTDGKPLRSDLVTFGGWRRGPWYVLDGTHPKVQQHFESLFRTMRREWGCTYFKFDANFWGAIHGGHFNDPRATRIEAYRRGMEAILRGAGDSFILGCNHPIWPSLGLIHGSRSSNDIKRTWERVATTARQNLQRNWQNGRLWWNDPDAVVLTGNLTEDEFQFHATAIFASGGMILSGDDLTKISEQKLVMLRKLQPPTGVAARFDDNALRIGRIRLPGREMICLFNWDDVPRKVTFRPTRISGVTDFWSGEELGREREFTVEVMPPHSARLFTCR